MAQIGDILGTETKIAKAVVAAEHELRRARLMHPRPFVSAHEGYGVLIEEVEELFDEIKANNRERALVEAKQVAAMALRFMVELG